MVDTAYCPCPPHQTASTGLRDHFRRVVGRARALVGALPAAQAAVFHDSPGAAGHGHSLLVEGIQEPFWDRASSRSGCHGGRRCMRLAGACCHIHLLRRGPLRRRSGRLGACRISG